MPPTAICFFLTMIALSLVFVGCTTTPETKANLQGAFEDVVVSPQTNQKVELRIREYNNQQALLALENNTDKPIYIVYQPTTRRIPARVVYHIMQKLSEKGKPRRLTVESQSRGIFWGWNVLSPQTTVLFRAFIPTQLKGQYRVVLYYLESAETADLVNHFPDDPKTFDELIARRNRELIEVQSAWMQLPVKAGVKFSNNSTRAAVNELPAPGEQDIFENEISVSWKIRDIASGQINYFYDHNEKRYGSFEEPVAKGWIKAKDKEYSGYKVTMTLSEGKRHYKVEAVPIKYGVTGIYSFYDDDEGTLRAADKQGGLATADDPSFFTQSRWKEH